MTTRRHVIYHPRGRGFVPALERALEERGVVFRPIAEASDLSDGLACSVWFYGPLREPFAHWRLAKRLRRFNVPLLAWNRDAPHYLNRAGWRLDLLARARVFDIYATHTLVDSRRQFADTVLYLPNAADTTRYGLGDDPDGVLARLRDARTYHVDVSFFGGMNGQRYKEDATRAEFFSELARRLDALGITHDFREAEGMDVAAQISFIQSSRINLNFGARCEYRAPVASGLPERCYGIPACGGFLLCDKRTHARDDFTPGDNWAEFDGIDDCVAQIRHWLAHFDAARALAERCCRHVAARHTYAHRAATLHDALLAWHEHRSAKS